MNRLSSKEIEALEFAVAHHANQTDKQGKSYILHVLRVAFSVFENSTENVLIAALLHDVVEDCGVTLDEIATRFGTLAAAVVDRLTRRSKEPYEDYIARLSPDPVARRVKLADLTDNMDEQRMGSLDEQTQKWLRRRYAKAVSVLETQL